MTIKNINIDLLKSNKETVKKLSAEVGLGLFYTKIVRPLSFYLALIFLRINVTANQVTFLSLVLGLISCIFFTIGGNNNCAIALVVLFFAILFDFADGIMARFNKQATYYGSFLDGVSDAIIHSLIPLSVGIGFYNKKIHGEILVLEPVYFLILGSYLSLIIIFRECIRWRYYAQLYDMDNNYTQNSDLSIESQPQKKAPGILNFFKKMSNVLSSVENNIYPLILLFLLTDYSELYIIFHLLIVVITTFLYVSKTLLRAKSNFQKRRTL